MRWKRWLKRIVLVVVICLLGYSLVELGNHEWIKVRGKRELAAALSETDAQDAGWRWDDLIAARKPLPDEENSAQLLVSVSAKLPRDWGKQPGEQIEWTGRLNVPSNTYYSSGTLEQIRPDRDRTDDAIPLARGLKKLRHGLPEAVVESPGEEGKYSGNVLRVAVLLEADTRVAIEQRDDRLASDNLIAILNVARSLDEEPGLYPHILQTQVRLMAWHLIERSLALGDTTSETWRKSLPILQEAIQQDLDTPTILTAIRGERARVDRFLEKITNMSINEFAKFGNVTPGELWNPYHRLELWQYKAKIPFDRAFAIRMFNLAAQHARLPMHEQVTAPSQLPVPHPIAMEYYFSRLMRGLLDHFLRHSWQEAAEARCALTGIACERYRLLHGRWPKALSDLQPVFLPTIPLDPFDGKPVRYRILDDGVLVYSTGRMTDHFGKEKNRAGLPLDAELAFRLWDPSSRRQPAPPDPDPVPIDPN